MGRDVMVNLPLHDAVHLKGNKFGTSLKIKATRDSKLSDSPAFFFLFLHFCHAIKNSANQNAEKLFSIAANLPCMYN